MRALLADLTRFAGADANVLVVGETGAGKDLVARALHQSGSRQSHPFVVIDCPGLAPSLLESELFGHERGAFTDATTARAGRFEAAGRGTVYLDRVDELPLDSQGKLLRIVEQKQVERLGSGLSVPVHARVVASASEEIEQAVREGQFRTDLFHRLRVLPLRVPPLRERHGDLRPLVATLLRGISASLDRPTPRVSDESFALLEGHQWPGNVRELKHTLERALMDDEDGVLSPDDLPGDLVSPVRVADGAAPERPTLEDLERRYIAFVLRETRGNQTRAAEILGISRKALWEKRRRFGMN